jgi:hypothetical protein
MSSLLLRHHTFSQVVKNVSAEPAAYIYRVELPYKELGHQVSKPHTGKRAPCRDPLSKFQSLKAAGIED